MLYIKPYSSKTTTAQNLEWEYVKYGKYLICGRELTIMKTSEEGEILLTWVATAFEIMQVRVDDDTKEFRYSLRIYTSCGDITCTVSKSVFTKRGLDELTKYGLSYDASLSSKLLEYAALAETEAEKVKEYTRLGWKDGCFWGYPLVGTEYTGSVQLSETKDYDVTELNTLLQKAAGLQFALTVGASSCLLSYLGQELPLTTPIVHFYGDTSQGKSTALQMAAAVWGKPTIDSKLFTTWNSTELALMNKLTNNFGVCVALDESSICKLDFTSTIYNLSQGVNRQRLQRDGKECKTREWLTVLISSGESSLLANSNQNGGLKVRAFEFEMQITKSAEHSDSIKQFVMLNYGYIGKAFVELLRQADFTDVKKRFLNRKEYFLGTVPNVESLPIAQRVADYYAIWLLTAELLQKSLGIQLEQELLAEIFRTHLQTLAGTFDLGIAVYEVICSRVVAKRSLYPDQGTYYGGSVEGLITKHRELILLASVFEKLLTENGFSDRLICLKALERFGVLKRQRRDTYYSKRTIARVAVQTVVIDLAQGLENIETLEKEGITL